MSGNLQDEILSKGSEIQGIFSDQESKFNQEQLQLESETDNLENKMDRLISTFSQINRYQINFSPTHSTASSDNYEEDKDDDTQEVTNNNVNNTNETNAVQSNLVHNNNQSTQHQKAPTRSTFKFNNIFSSNDKNKPNTSNSPIESNEIKRKHNQIENNNLNSSISNNPSNKSSSSVSNISTASSKPLISNPDFSKVFSKPLQKPEEIYTKIPDKTKEMNDDEAQKEGLIPLTAEMYKRIQDNNNQVPQDILEKNMENLNLNKEVIICNYCKKQGHQVDYVRQPHLKAINKVATIPEGKVKVNKCSRCRTVYQCGEYCQKSDWVTHKVNCIECCFNCQRRKDKMMKCGGCKKAIYCNQECQSRHWKDHKVACLKVSK